MGALGPLKPQGVPAVPALPLVQQDGRPSQSFYRFLQQLSRQAYEGEVPGTTQLISPQFLTTSAALLFLASAPVRVDTVVATNSTSGAVIVSIYLVGAGGIPTPANLITVQSIPANSTAQLTTAQGHLIPGGSSLYAAAATAGAVSLTASGVLV